MGNGVGAGAAAAASSKKKGVTTPSTSIIDDITSDSHGNDGIDYLRIGIVLQFKFRVWSLGPHRVHLAHQFDLPLHELMVANLLRDRYLVCCSSHEAWLWDYHHRSKDVTIAMQILQSESIKDELEQSHQRSKWAKPLIVEETPTKHSSPALVFASDMRMHPRTGLVLCSRVLDQQLEFLAVPVPLTSSSTAEDQRVDDSDNKQEADDTDATSDKTSSSSDSSALSALSARTVVGSNINMPRPGTSAGPTTSTTTTVVSDNTVRLDDLISGMRWAGDRIVVYTSSTNTRHHATHSNHSYIPASTLTVYELSDLVKGGTLRTLHHLDITQIERAARARLKTMHDNAINALSHHHHDTSTSTKRPSFASSTSTQPPAPTLTLTTSGGTSGSNSGIEAPAVVDMAMLPDERWLVLVLVDSSLLFYDTHTNSFLAPHSHHRTRTADSAPMTASTTSGSASKGWFRPRCVAVPSFGALYGCVLIGGSYSSSPLATSSKSAFAHLRAQTYSLASSSASGSSSSSSSIGVDVVDMRVHDEDIFVERITPLPDGRLVTVSGCHASIWHFTSSVNTSGNSGKELVGERQLQFVERSPIRRVIAMPASIAHRCAMAQQLRRSRDVTMFDDGCDDIVLHYVLAIP
jgi:hypothetical protein